MLHNDLIRTGEAATILGSSRQHVVDLCNQGFLSFERTNKQRRLRRPEVEAFARLADSNRDLNRDQRQSLWLHGAVAGHLVVDPAGVLARAGANLDRLRSIHRFGMSAQWLDTWASVLSDGPEAALQILTSGSPLAVELRQNSPFAGVLSPDERTTILDAFRAHERDVLA